MQSGFTVSSSDCTRSQRCTYHTASPPRWRKAEGNRAEWRTLPAFPTKRRHQRKNRREAGSQWYSLVTKSIYVSFLFFFFTLFFEIACWFRKAWDGVFIAVQGTFQAASGAKLSQERVGDGMQETFCTSAPVERCGDHLGFLARQQICQRAILPRRPKVMCSDPWKSITNFVKFRAPKDNVVKSSRSNDE